MNKKEIKINKLNNVIIMVLLLFISLLFSMLIMIINITDDEIFINYLSQKDLKDEIYIKPKDNENYLSNQAIQFLNKEISKDSNILYRSKDINFLKNYKNEKLFYHMLNDNIYFKAIDKNEFDNMKVIGEYPQKDNEIIINEILAYDILTDYNSKVINIKEKLTSVEELINKGIFYKNKYLKVTGIVQEDLKKYELLLSENNREETDLYKEFELKYSIKRNVILVNEEFLKNDIEYKYNKNVKYQDEIINVNLNIATLKDEEDIYNGVSLTKSINNLNEDEIIIDLNLVDILNNGDLKEKYINIKWNELKFQDDNEYYEFFKQFIINYLHNTDLVGKELILDNKSYIIKGIYIKYISYNGNKYSLAFVKSDILNNYIKEDLVSILEFKDLNNDDISKIYNQSSKYDFDILTKYDNNLKKIIDKKNIIKNYIIYINVILSIILFVLLIINYKINKNQIKDLKKNKCYKFLLLELLSAMVLNYIVFYILNSIYFEKSLIFNYSSIIFIIINVAFLNFILLLSNNIKLNL